MVSFCVVDIKLLLDVYTFVVLNIRKSSTSANQHAHISSSKTHLNALWVNVTFAFSDMCTKCRFSGDNGDVFR